MRVFPKSNVRIRWRGELNLSFVNYKDDKNNDFFRQVFAKKEETPGLHYNGRLAA